MATDKVQLGYDVGTMASLALTGMVGPRAYNTGEAYSVALSSLGGK